MHEERAGWVEDLTASSQHFVQAGEVVARCGRTVAGVRRPEPNRGSACRACVRLEMGFAPGE